MTIRTFGVEIGISFDDPDLRPAVIERLPPRWNEAKQDQPHRTYRLLRPVNSYHGLIVDKGHIRPYPTREKLLDFLEGDIQIFVAEFATPHLFVHAGVVAIDGQAILIPGRSFAGKSTLVTSLVMAGATYYSDEYAVLDDRGYVLPYPRRVSLRPGPHGDGRLDLGERAPRGAAAEHAIPVSTVALLRYDSEAGWDVRELDILTAMMAMSEQTVAIQRRPAATFATLEKLVRSARVIQGTRGDAGETVARLLSHR